MKWQIFPEYLRDEIKPVYYSTKTIFWYPFRQIMEHILDETVPNEDLKKFEQKYHEELNHGKVSLALT